MTPGQAVKLIGERLEAGETILRWGDAALPADAGPGAGAGAVKLRGAAAVTNRRLFVVCGEQDDPRQLVVRRSDISAAHSYWEHLDQHSVIVTQDGSEHVVYGLSTSVRGALAVDAESVVPRGYIAATRELRLASTLELQSVDGRISSANGSSGNGSSGNGTSGNGSSGNGSSGDGTSADGTSGDQTSETGTLAKEISAVPESAEPVARPRPRPTPLVSPPVTAEADVEPKLATLSPRPLPAAAAGSQLTGDRADSTPAESPSTRSTSAKSTSAKSKPARSTSAKSTSAKSTSAKSTSAKSTSAKSKPARSTSAKSTSAKSKPARSTSTESKPAESASATSKPAESPLAEAPPSRPRPRPRPTQA